MSIPSSTTNLGKSKLDTPDFTLVAQAIFADDLEFGITVSQSQEGISDMKHRQADAQWPGYVTYRRADSKAACDHVSFPVLQQRSEGGLRRRGTL